jgi:hypothetical protein
MFPRALGSKADCVSGNGIGDSQPIHIDIGVVIERLHAFNRSESGIGRFSPELHLVFRPAVNSVNQRGRKNYMNSLIQLNRQLRFLLVTLLFACFAIAQSAQAVSPEADEDSLNVSAAEEDNAVLDLSSVTGNAAPTATPVNKYIVKKGNKPNKWEVHMDFTKQVMCALEPVRFRGELQISFSKTSRPMPESVTLVGQLPGKPFSALGTGKKPTLGRTYVLQNKFGQRVQGHPDETNDVNGLGIGKFRRDFTFRAKSNLPGEEVEFTFKFVLPYDFENGTVTHVEDRRPEIIRCID